MLPLSPHLIPSTSWFALALAELAQPRGHDVREGRALHAEPIVGPRDLHAEPIVGPRDLHAQPIVGGSRWFHRAEGVSTRSSPN